MPMGPMELPIFKPYASQARPFLGQNMPKQDTRLLGAKKRMRFLGGLISDLIHLDSLFAFSLAFRGQIVGVPDLEIQGKDFLCWVSTCFY